MRYGLSIDTMTSSPRLVLLAVRAIATGILVTLAFRFLVAIPLTVVVRVWGRGPLLPQWFVASVLPGLLPALGSGLAGWVVGRTHRERQVTMVVSYAAFVVFLTLPRLYALVTAAATDVRFVTSLFNYLLNIMINVGGVLAGGVWLAAPVERDTSTIRPL